MKDFSRSSYSFSTVSLGQKLVYSSFLLFMVAGWVTFLVFYAKETGWSYQSLVDYYRGNEEKFLFPKTFYALWEVTHFHIFTIPVVYLILIHLFMLTRASFTWKVGGLAASVLGMGLDIGSPWLIVYAGPVWAWAKVFGRLLLNGTLLLFIAWPFWEMWWAPRKSSRPGRLHPS